MSVFGHLKPNDGKTDYFRNSKPKSTNFPGEIFPLRKNPVTIILCGGLLRRYG